MIKISYPTKCFEKRKKKCGQYWGKAQFLKVDVVIGGGSEKTNEDWF